MQSAWDIYFKEPEKFDLGFLPTEQSHPKSIGLTEMGARDLSLAFKMFQEIDLEALDYLLKIRNSIHEIRDLIQKAFIDEKKIFLCGCGATGRLSLFLESWFKSHFPGSESVLSFMAGGDYALVRSVEGMEDHPHLGARHLLEMGFQSGDYLISFTEGGETPYVIGATEEAASLSPGNVIFLFCNPENLLRERIDRCASVLNNPNIRSLSLGQSPMALSGSTRLQATTVLTLVGAYLLQPSVNYGIELWIEELKSNLTESNYNKMSQLTIEESEIYKKGEYVNYLSKSFSLTVLTDTTERSPTFSLTSFENSRFKDDDFSWCYLFVAGAKTAGEAWKKILNRPVRPLDWEELDYRRGDAYLGFDMSEAGMLRRRQRLSKPSYDFKIEKQSEKIIIESPKSTLEFKVMSSDLLDNLLLKVMLNAHSTLLMGLMGRSKSNVMTYVRPSNAKLIDRSIRYISYLLVEKNIRMDKEIIGKILVNVFEKEESDQALVIKVFNHIIENPDRPFELLRPTN